MMELILASASPRRRDLLQQIGWQFKVHPSGFQESTAAQAPQAFVLYNALGKAREVSKQFPTSLVLGADTIVVHAGRILGKPRDKADAAAMLRALSGNWHDVFTAVALVNYAGGHEVSDVVRTRVHMRKIAASELDLYLQTDEPYDKAGAYGIQGMAAVFVDKIEGCYYNVVGLPLSRLAELRQQIDAAGARQHLLPPLCEAIWR